MITNDPPIQPKEWDDPLFEAGRQHVLSEIDRCIKMRRHFLTTIVDETNNQTKSIEFKRGTIDGFDQILSMVKMLNTWQIDRKRHANDI